MNKTDFIRELSRRVKLTNKDCKNCLNAITTLVTQRLVRGDSVSFLGFGKFEVKHRASRKSFNPITKKQMFIPATRVPSFKAGKLFRQAVSM